VRGTNRDQISPQDPSICLEWCRTIWTRMLDQKDGGVKMTHSGYLKKYQLSNPKLHLEFDVLLMDESQVMCDPATP
jgi:hypothetical protein